MITRELVRRRRRSREGAGLHFHFGVLAAAFVGLLRPPLPRRSQLPGCRLELANALFARVLPLRGPSGNQLRRGGTHSADTRCSPNYAAPARCLPDEDEQLMRQSLRAPRLRPPALHRSPAHDRSQQDWTTTAVQRHVPAHPARTPARTPPPRILLGLFSLRADGCMDGCAGWLPDASGCSCGCRVQASVADRSGTRPWRGTGRRGASACARVDITFHLQSGCVLVAPDIAPAAERAISVRPATIVSGDTGGSAPCPGRIRGHWHIGYAWGPDTTLRSACVSFGTAPMFPCPAISSTSDATRGGLRKAYGRGVVGTLKLWLAWPLPPTNTSPELIYSAHD